ncbi:MAG TPA: ImmA/IrrE family metallo-endopeptidase [Limnochordia bacterium]|nr:ImmA/IrrE family metallo-endopeptidase [Limnochordia bacterium]
MELAVPRRGLALDAAQTILNVLKIRQAPVVPERVAKALGHQLVESTLPEIDGFSLRHRDRHLIFVDRRLSLGRRRFTIAHELGHIILGHLLHVRTSQTTDRMMDKEANCFAAELLMPRHLIAPQASTSIDNLAQTFGLTPELVRMRLVQLGLEGPAAGIVDDPFDATYPQLL